ncbi:hypothetical protein [Nocardia mexicana]|uniref:Uncharacterized protein n=1 Tax=Nocardia mexicana TaxID=279262 RepID=A0A370GSU2_9NOCA|nr:hypothetical protein [Nocardia mexicana]RDI46767.1 hypothetical protein DFR68_110173 [Nocardia mexicana]
MNLRPISACLAATAIVLGAGVALGAGSSSARPFGLAGCGAQPEDSRMVTTCGNDDDAPASGYMQALCTNLRIFWSTYTLEPNSTQQFVEDCGPGAHPILWNAQAQTLWQRQQQDEWNREQDDYWQRQQWQRDQDRQNRQLACPPGTTPGTMNGGTLC